MPAILPDAIDLKVNPVKRKKGGVQRYEFVYTEFFENLPKEVFENTMKVGKVLLEAQGFSVCGERNGKKAVFTASIVAPRARIGNFLFGEFLMWTTLGDLKFKDLLISLVAARATTAASPPTFHPTATRAPAAKAAVEAPRLPPPDARRVAR